MKQTQAGTLPYNSSRHTSLHLKEYNNNAPVAMRCNMCMLALSIPNTPAEAPSTAAAAVLIVLTTAAAAPDTAAAGPVAAVAAAALTSRVRECMGLQCLTTAAVAAAALNW
jgi:hypothetical protein